MKLAVAVAFLCAFLQAAKKDPAVTLKWQDKENPKADTYNAYRNTGPCPPQQPTSTKGFTKINTVAIDGKTFKDTTVKANKTYSYVVTAVGAKGPQSVPSNCFQILVP
jgi:fibronectin type 3 domain-containing protein